MPVKDRPISGLLNINKPKGLTSHDVVAHIRKLSGQRKVGHTGTLDPMATGVLLVCVGQATRLIEYLMSGRKQYRATIQFGKTTNTLDADGEILTENDASDLTQTKLKNIVPQFQGTLQQIPPIFSAIKKNGQPLYKQARAGQQVEVEPRTVTVYKLTWVDWNPPNLTLDISCSSGTYIRSLARDIGEAAGTGAHLAQLTRTANGSWHIDDAVSLNQLEQAGDNWRKFLHQPDQGIAHLPQVILDGEAVEHIRHGRQIPANLTTMPPTGDKIELARAYTPAGEFIAILKLVESDGNIWQPKKVFSI
jgi:tRNA pseudouridine55 synthase